MILSVNNLILSGLYLPCTAYFRLSIGHCTYVGGVSFSFKIETHTNTLLSVKLSKTQLDTNLYETKFEFISNLWFYHFFSKDGFRGNNSSILWMIAPPESFFVCKKRNKILKNESHPHSIESFYFRNTTYELKWNKLCYKI